MKYLVLWLTMIGMVSNPVLSQSSVVPGEPGMPGYWSGPSSAYAGAYFSVDLQRDRINRDQLYRYGFQAGLDLPGRSSRNLLFARSEFSRDFYPFDRTTSGQRGFRYDFVTLNFSSRGFETAQLANLAVLARQDNVTIWQQAAGEESTEESGGFSGWWIAGGILGVLAVGTALAADGIGESIGRAGACAVTAVIVGPAQGDEFECS